MRVIDALACVLRDFGEAWEDQRYAWVIPLTNPTHATVRVLDVRASCTCVNIEPRTFTIPPGGTRDIKLVLDLTPRAIETAGTTRKVSAATATISR